MGGCEILGGETIEGSVAAAEVASGRIVVSTAGAVGGEGAEGGDAGGRPRPRRAGGCGPGAAPCAALLGAIIVNSVGSGDLCVLARYCR